MTGISQRLPPARTEECFEMQCDPNWFDVDGQIQHLGRAIHRSTKEIGDVASGNDCYIANWKMAIEIVDFPIENCYFP